MASCIAVDLGGTNLRAALVRSDGSVRLRTSMPTLHGRTHERVLLQLAGTIGRLAGAAAARGLKLGGTALAVPGFIHARKGIVHSSPNFPGWNRVPLAALLKRRLGMRVLVENDANCAALGEQWKGRAKGLADFVFLTLGTGIGGGIVVAGRLVRGARGAGSEAGHICINPNGPRCGCGNRGCLEVMASGGALKRKTGRTGRELARRAREGDRRARAAFEEMGRWLGVGVGSLCFLFDPDAVILGGRLSSAHPFFKPALIAEMKRRLKNHPSRGTPVRIARCGDDAGLLGAARLLFDRRGRWRP